MSITNSPAEALRIFIDRMGRDVYRPPAFAGFAAGTNVCKCTGACIQVLKK